jgi:V/A-type H+-transporting ATPase subunit K
MDGRGIAILGLALCLILCGAGSAFGLFKAGSAAAGVLSEDNKKFSKVLVLALLPATQGIYGFVYSVIKLGTLPDANAAQYLGWIVFASALALGVTGMLSAIFQGKAAAACIYAVGKNDAGSGRYILFPAMIEFYAILALVLGIML